MIQLIKGSIFDFKCDLLIVPCNSSGNVTPPIYKYLHEKDLPTKIGHIPFGRIHFREVKYEYASTIGYAASADVEKIITTCHEISRIAESIVKYSTENQILRVNVPLLGSGAGCMAPLDSFYALQENFGVQEDITFNVFCLTQEIFKEISANAKIVSGDLTKMHPRVFISYTGIDKENALWVKALARALRANGVDARIDVFHLKPGFDLPQWMTNEVIMADKVLLICEKYYIEKSDFLKGGVGWETMIIQGDMLAQGNNRNKYIAIMREDEFEKGTPIYLRSKYAFNWSNSNEIDDDRLKDLILCIFDCEIEPKLGSIPQYIKQKK